MARIFNESKTFVDMRQRQPASETLQLFEEFMAVTGGNPNRDQVQGPSEKVLKFTVRQRSRSVRRRLLAAESPG